MVEDLPAPIRTTPAGPTPVSVTVADWSTAAAELEERLGVVPALTDDLVLELAPEALLLAGAEDIWYLAVDGSIEYVVEGQPWLSFLLAVDGVRTLRQLLGGTRTSLPAIREELVTALECGVLVAVAPDAPPLASRTVEVSAP
jgi:hypothetical protein